MPLPPFGQGVLMYRVLEARRLTWGAAPGHSQCQDSLLVGPLHGRLDAMNKPRLSTVITLAAIAGGAAAAGTGASRSIDLRFDSAPGAARLANGASAPGPPAVSVVGEERLEQAPQRERNPQLAADRLVIVGVDEHGVELARAIVPDPRIIRAEVAGPDETLSPAQVSVPGAEFSVLLPDDPGIVALRIYQPRWTGQEFVLELLGQSPLP